MPPAKRSQDVDSRKVIDTIIGEIEYLKEDVLFMPEGMYGFEDSKYYILWEDKRFTPFYWVISIDSPGLLFPVIPPLAVVDSYEPKLPRDTRDELKMLIVTIGETRESVTANLRAPLVIYLDQKIMKQIILTDTQFPLRQKINQPEPLTEQ